MMGETEIDKAQRRFDEFMKVLAAMSEKDWQAYLNGL